jgi:pimeloyl-ACP methyl ester carboxylesterase
MTDTNSEKQLQVSHPQNAQLQTGGKQGPTLLPRTLASIVTTVCGASSLTVKIGSKIGGFWIAGARETTLTSLELTRAGIEAVLVAAGRDVSTRSHGEMGQREAEGILERSVAALHSSVSTVSFFASTGFYLSAVALNQLSDLSISGLSTLNAILGSTESSRAVAAIITLLSTEMKKAPDGSVAGEKVSYTDLLIGTTGFVLLQRWGRRKTERDFRSSGGEETIWDTVIDDKGFRADVVGTSRKEAATGVEATKLRRRSFCSPAGEDGFEALERGTLNDGPTLSISPEDQTRLTDEELRAHIASQLPAGARAVITSETTTLKTIKVQIYDAGTATIEAPPGTMMVAERLNHKDGSGDSNTLGAPHQTIVFRTGLKRADSAEMEVLSDSLRLTTTADEEPGHGDPDSGDELMMQESPKRKRKPAASPIRQNGNISPGTDEEPPISFGAVANQKRTRRPDSASDMAARPTRSPVTRIPAPRPDKEKPKMNSKADKSGTFKKALKSLSPSQSSTAVKDLSGTTRKNKSFINNNILSNTIPQMTATTPKDSFRNKPLPDPQQQRRNASVGRTGYLSSPIGRTTPIETFYSVHEKRRESTVSEVDTYSIHSVESRPGSPTFTRTHSRTTSGIKKTQSDTDFGVWTTTSREDAKDPPDGRHHQRSKSFVPSLYSMTTKNSEEALILEVKTPMPRPSIFEDSAILTALINSGRVPGMFPNQHLVRTVRRFARFASASYGSNFLRVMGLVTSDTSQISEVKEVPADIHHEHTSFSSHTGLPPDTILLSSWVDPQGVTGNTEWSPTAISPLVHYLSVDHDSKAIVLTCRGTLGFEDVLTDMTCDYDDLYWQGRPYKVHKGINASARRMLGGSGRHVMAMIKATLEEYSDYGFVLCGHSLGGAVAAILAILIAEQSPDDLREKSAFITSTDVPKLLISSGAADPTYHAPPLTLPAGRPIHVYSYGTPACLSEELRLATRGLITTVVNHNDFFPSLSIGTLHDFRGVALNLKTDTTGAYKKLKSRVWDRALWAGKNAFYTESARGPPPADHMAGDGLQEDTWAWAALKTLRAGMTSEKLVPAGEVFVVETNRVFDRQSDTFMAGGIAGDTATERVYRSLGRPATRIQFKLVKDVEGRFGELRFGKDMFAEHSPGRYEANLAALERGILDV